MDLQSGGGLKLPKFLRTKKQRNWVETEQRTAKLIQTLWKAADHKQRIDPDFLCLLVQCGWTNATRKPGGDSIRRWRNNNIAEYIRVPYRSDEQLADDLSSRFKSLSVSSCRSLLASHTGITLYRNTYRDATLKYVNKHPQEIAKALRLVSTTARNVQGKVGEVAAIIESLGKVPASGRQVSPFNGLTPTLSCLDPQCRFPIMNINTRNLLRSIPAEPNAEGLVKLSKLIGHTIDGLDLRNAFELDVYACSNRFVKPPRQSYKLKSRARFSDVGLKSEINSTSQINAKQSVITKKHNALINRLREYLLWRHRECPKEHRFDALILGWKPGRDLLIEAKTASEGTSGRAQVRQAIGQLYDYRFTHMPKNTVDLAVLLPKEPSSTVMALLATLGIEVLWFRGKALNGTISL